MINFCKKSFSTLFNTASTTLSPPKHDSFAYDHHRITPLPVYGAGLNFLTTLGEIPKHNNVIESSSLINSPVKIDQIGSTGRLNVLSSGNIDKLASCTESLGFESCNERSVNNDFDNSKKSGANGKSIKVDKKNKKAKNKSFPPPLSTLNGNGKPMFSLRPVRNNGRLKLIEVKFYRPETLRASRENGRLRLHIVRSDHKKDGAITSNDDDKDKKIVKELKFPTSRRGGDQDCRWVDEMTKNQHQQHHNLHGYGQVSASGEESVQHFQVRTGTRQQSY